MNYDTFIEVLEKYVSEKKQLAHVIYDDEQVVKYVEDILDQKLNHTKRVVDYVFVLAQKMQMHINYERIVIASGLFHDIGRFNQGLKFRSYNDSLTFSNGQNHGDYGYELITKNPEEISIFEKIVDEKAQPVVATTVKYHQRRVLPPSYNKRLTEDLRKTNPDMILTGSYDFNELEKQILSALLQMVRDADRIDILWQRATGEIAPFNDNIFLKNTGNVSEMAKRWGVSEKVILANNDEERLSSKPNIIIPREYIPVEKLIVSPNLMERMKNFEHIDLRSLQQESDYTFITALWWSIYTFLKDMNFVDNLKQIKERKLLEQIYDKYPDYYRPLIDKIFKFAKETLIDEQINKSKDELYVNNPVRKP